MGELLLYHISNITPVNIEDKYKLGKILDTCIRLKIFIVGYNILEIANTDDRVLFALLMKDESIAIEFEKKTYLKLVRVESVDGQSE